MADNFLSQEEVDALLKGVNGDQDDAQRRRTSGVVLQLATQERIVRGGANVKLSTSVSPGAAEAVQLRRAAEGRSGPGASRISEFIRNLVVRPIELVQ